ncbi:hypothetical protein JCM8097_009212 [Rhodosporidiobolus ruineniae]
MDEFIDELQGFTPRQPVASSSSVPIDPALAGPGPSSAANRARRGADAYWDDDDHDSYYSSDAYAQDHSGEGEEDDDGDETDAEDEFAATQRQGGTQKRARPSQGGVLAEDGSYIPGGSYKGKERAAVQGDDDEEDETEDIGRLISAMGQSGQGALGDSTALTREFDRSIAYELADFDPDLIEDMSVGIKGRKRQRGKRGGGRRAAADVEPSPEVKRLLGQANQAYSEGRHLEAVELLSEVVRIDPIIRTSWYTLATIYEELGDLQKSVQAKIVATHLMGAKKAAADWVELGRQSRDLGLLHQAIYCFTQAVKANKEDVDAMWDRAILLKLSGATTMAIRAFLALLSLLPHDPGVLRELAPLLASTQQYTQAITLFLSAFAYYRQLVPIVTSQTVDLLNTYGYGELETLADFLLLQRNYAEVVRVVRQGVRWLQGREKETGWDSMSDDREYDEERKVREGWEKGNTWFELEPTYELDVRLRSRLGLARLGMGWTQEAQRHFDIVTGEDVAEFPELFGAIGEAFYERGMYENALEVYQLIAENEETNGPTAWFKIAQCHQATGDFEDARECYENVVAEEPDNLEAKLALAKVLEQLSEPGRALQLIKEVISTREAQQEEESSAGGRRRRTWVPKEQREAARLNREDAERARQAEFGVLFAQLADLDADGSISAGSAAEEAVNHWLEIATRLVESFRSTKQLFPSDFKVKFRGMNRAHWKNRGKKKERDIGAEADQMADRLQQTIDAEDDEEMEETTFRGLDFDQWVDFILKYTFLLARMDEIELAAEVLLHVREAGVMRQSQSRQEALRFGLIACYQHAGMHVQLVNEYRWFLRAYPLQSEPLRLLLALISQHATSIEAFNDVKLQKFFIRQMKQIQQQVAPSGEKPSGSGGAGGTASSPAAARKSASGAVKGKKKAAEDGAESDEGDEGEDGEGFDGATSSFKPTKLSPLFLTIYGCMLNVSQSHQGAIIYLIRAYELDKKQPLVNLVLASAYLQRAMSRKTDNRQHQIAQAFAFLDQYRRLRGACHETEYNLARAFHHLGLHSHAVKHYETLLSMPAPAASPPTASSSSADAMPLDDDPALPAPPSAASDDKDDKADKYAALDYRRVAAYNLVTLYAMTNLPELARGVAERWLAV